MVGDEASEAIVTAFKRAEERYLSELKSRDALIESGTQILQQLQGSVVAMQSEKIRQEMLGTNPQLSNDQAWEQVIQKGNELAQTGQYADLDSVLSTAVDVLYGGHARKQLAAQQHREVAARDNGQALPGLGLPRQTEDVEFYEELEDKVLAALDSGDSALVKSLSARMEGAPRKGREGDGRIFFKK